MSLLQIIYMSHPLGFDESTLHAILVNSRRNNLREDVTGALICRGDAYLQLIEGPEAAIRRAYERIARDKRHANISFLFGEPVTHRVFPEWAMRDDPARSWMWTHAEVAAGAITKSTRPELLAVFERLKAEQP